MSGGGNERTLALVSISPTVTDAGSIVGPLYVEIPVGVYGVSMTHWETAYAFGTPKVAITFYVISPDTYAGTPLIKWYRVKAIDEHGRRFGRFEVGPLQALVADHVRLIKPLQGASLSLDPWRTVPLRAYVETVESATGIRYSVIRQLERAE